MSPPSRGVAVLVLDADPDLAAGIHPAAREAAERASLAPLLRFERGPWRFFPRSDAGTFGALILDGVVAIRTEIGTRGHLELLSQGDVLSPWSANDPDFAMPCPSSATILSRVELAVLDRAFALRTARWPEVNAALIQRIMIRSRRMSLQAAINSRPRIEERLELTLWHLADRFGHVTSAGIRLHLPITCTQLADMVAARRPSVSVALARVLDHGHVVREARHDWLLCGPPPPDLVALAQQSELV